MILLLGCLASKLYDVSSLHKMVRIFSKYPHHFSHAVSVLLQLHHYPSHPSFSFRVHAEPSAVFYRISGYFIPHGSRAVGCGAASSATPRPRRVPSHRWAPQPFDWQGVLLTRWGKWALFLIILQNQMVSHKTELHEDNRTDRIGFKTFLYAFCGSVLTKSLSLPSKFYGHGH